MKKRARSLIAVLLTMALVLVIGIPGLAAGIGIFPNDDNRYTIQPVKHYDTYTVLGDSITAGVNCQDYYRYYNADGTYVSSGSVDYDLIAKADHWDRGDSRRVEGTYPALVEDMVTADTVNHFSRIGYRTDELRILLCDDYYGDDLTPTLLEFLGETYSVDINGWIKNRPAFQQAVADADLLTLGIGSNDVLMTVWFNAIGMLYGENASLGEISQVIGNIAQSTQNPTNMMSAILQLMNSAFGTTKTLAELAQAMMEAEIDFRTNFKAITDRIYELNPDVDLVVVGVYNGAKEIRVSKDIDLQAGKLGDAAFMAINNYMANLCPNHKKYKYVDVWNITLGEAPSLLDMIQNIGLIGSLMTVDHPTETGHAEIAKEIRAVLPKVDSKTEVQPKTTKAAENQAAEANAAEANAAEANAAEVKAEGTRAVEARAEDTKAAEPKAAEVKATEVKATEVKETPAAKAEEPAKRWVKQADDGNWYCYMGDDIEYSYTGIAQNQYGWWRIVNGKVDFGANSIYQNEFGWWKCTNGKVTFNENGIYQNQYGWWKCTNSKVTFQETGIFQNKYGKWYCKNSKVDFTKNGKVSFQGKTYTVKNGKAF